MKHLFVARHGSYGADRRIDNDGREQIADLGKTIKQILNESSSYLFCSAVPRAIDSAQILVAQLNLPQEFEKVLDFGIEINESLRYGSYNIQRKFVKAREEKADGIIIVTHKPIVEDFLRYFPWCEFNKL